MTTRVEIEEKLDRAFQYYLDGEPQMALRSDLEALQLSKDLGEVELIARCGIEVSRSYRWLHKPKLALDAIHEALALFSQFQNDELLAYAQLIHARVLLQVGLTDDAYGEAAKVIKWANRSENLELKARAFDVQAIVFILASNFEKATHLLEQIQDIQDEHNFESLRVVLPVHHGFLHSRCAEHALEQGETQAHQDHFHIALMWTEQAVAAAEESKQSWYHFASLCNAAEFAAVRGKFAFAEQLLAKVKELPKGLMDVGAVHYLYTCSEVANRSGNTKTAIQFGLDALEAAKENPDADNVMNAHRRVAEAYEADRDFEAALKAYKQYQCQFKRSLARRAYWQDRMAEYKSNVKVIRDQLQRANVHAEKMTKEAHQDALTGLGNRRAFDQRLLQLETDPNAKFAIAILDLDHFKAINDNYSHLVGDDVLRHVADIMQEHCRAEDLVTRIGGEEFAILLPSASQERARIVCERIRKHIGGWDWSSLVDELVVTVSAGVATSEEGRSTLDVFAVADSRLYQAKTSGRDRVEAFANPGNAVGWA